MNNYTYSSSMAKAYAGYDSDSGNIEKSVKRVGVFPWNETTNIPIHMLRYVLKCTNMNIYDVESFVDDNAGALMYSEYAHDAVYLFFHDEEGITSAIRNWTKRKLAT